MKKPTPTGAGAVCAVMLGGALCSLVLLGAGCSDSATADLPTATASQGIPEHEFDSFSNIILNIDKAQADLDAAQKRGNRASIREAGALLTRQQEILDQLYIQKYGAQVIAQWASTVRSAQTAASAMGERPPSLKEVLEQLAALKVRTQVDQDGNVFSIDCANIELPDELVKQLALFKHLKTLNLSAAGITDEDLAHLKSMQNLHTLNISRNAIRGPGLRNLSGMSKLEVLHLNSTGLTDKSLPDMETFTHLKSIRVMNLEDTAFTTQGFERVTRLFRRADVRF